MGDDIAEKTRSVSAQRLRNKPLVYDTSQLESILRQAE